MATATISFTVPDYTITAEVSREGGQWQAAWAGIKGRGVTAEMAIADLHSLVQTTSAEEVANDLGK